MLVLLETSSTQSRPKGGNALRVQSVVSSSEAIAAQFDAVEHALGGIDVLVNDAGIMTISPIADAGGERIRRRASKRAMLIRQNYSQRWFEE